MVKSSRYKLCSSLYDNQNSIPAVFVYGISGIPRCMDTAVAKQNPRFQPVPLHR